MSTSSRRGLAWQLLPYLRPYWPRLLWSLIQVFLIAGFELLKPWPLQIIIDDVLGGRSIGVTWLSHSSPLAVLALACVGIVIVQLGAAALTVLHNYTSIEVGQRMVSDLRGALYSHLQRLSLGFHSRQQVGDLPYRVTSDSFAVQAILMNGVMPILSALVLLAGMLFILIPLEPILTVLSLTLLPSLFIVIILFNRRITRVATEVRDADSRVYALVHWAISSMKVIQAFTREEDEYRRFMGASRASLRASLRLYNWQSLYSSAVQTAVAAGTAIVVYAGARLALSGTLSVGHLLVFISYLAQLYTPASEITQSWGVIAGARVGARRVFEILETAADLKDGPLIFPSESVQGAIEWRNVSFGYGRQMPVLRSINLKIEPGTKVALVGPTGAGKSTLLGLLPRFFDPSDGSVAIDEVDIREYQIKSLRGQISMVLQPPLIFPISVRDNIAYGRPTAAEEEIQQAARLARIHERILALPEGYDTILGDSGIVLSEGEKQRLTIARAILRDAQILILDEPTSALDVQTEALVMEAIARLTEGRTTFIIAHRLSTVREADLILVLRDGVIIEQGSFNDLMRAAGFFADLYNMQFKELATSGTRKVRSGN